MSLEARCCSAHICPFVIGPQTVGMLVHTHVPDLVTFHQSMNAVCKMQYAPATARRCVNLCLT